MIKQTNQAHQTSKAITQPQEAIKRAKNQATAKNQARSETQQASREICKQTNQGNICKQIQKTKTQNK